MKHIVEKIEMIDGEIRLVDPDREDFIRIVESKDGSDLMFSLPGGKSYIVVDSKLMLGALKALVTHGERERINSRGR